MTVGQDPRSLTGLGHWILGREGALALSDLWDGLGHRVFSVRSLCGDEFTRGALVTDPSTLRKFEELFKDESGRSFGKIVPVDPQSSVLSSINDDFRFANHLLEEAKNILREASPWIALLYRKMVEAVIPIEHYRNGLPHRRGFSSGEALGLIFTTFLERKTKHIGARRAVLAVDLAHEIGHHALMLYQLGDPIFVSPADAPVYSAVRQSARPAIMALHANVAAAYMIETCLGILHDRTQSNADEKVYALASLSDFETQQRLGLESLRAQCRFTRLGELIMRDLEVQLAALKSNLSSRSAPRAGAGYFELNN